LFLKRNIRIPLKEERANPKRASSPDGKNFRLHYGPGWESQYRAYVSLGYLVSGSPNNFIVTGWLNDGREILFTTREQTEAAHDSAYRGGS
jgi:hypothetical protein